MERIFEESKGKDLSEIFEMCWVDSKVLSAEEVSPLAVIKDFSGFVEEESAQSILNEVKMLFNFLFIFLEEVVMTSSRKEVQK